MSNEDVVGRLHALAAREPDVAEEGYETPALDSTDDAETRIRHLLIALERRTMIGQATGILMERYTLAPGAAFGVLMRVSQQQNRKVYEIATQLVIEGHSEGL
jgi:AmiR/NasT family two-component response regulator